MLSDWNLTDTSLMLLQGGNNLNATDHGGDLNGYVWAKLEEPVTLAAGREYFLVSSEGGADTFFDQKVWMQPHPGLLSGLVRPVSTKALFFVVSVYLCSLRYSFIHEFIWCDRCRRMAGETGSSAVAAVCHLLRPIYTT